MESFSYYLWRPFFTIVTNHIPLQWWHHMKDSYPCLTWWYLAMQPYCFTMHYCQGWLHANARWLFLLTGCKCLLGWKVGRVEPSSGTKDSPGMETQCPAGLGALSKEVTSDTAGRHPEEEQADSQLLLQLPVIFVGTPFRGGKHALPGHGCSCRQSSHLKWKMPTFEGWGSVAEGDIKRSRGQKKGRVEDLKVWEDEIKKVYSTSLAWTIYLKVERGG